MSKLKGEAKAGGRTATTTRATVSTTTAEVQATNVVPGTYTPTQIAILWKAAADYGGLTNLHTAIQSFIDAGM